MTPVSSSASASHLTRLERTKPLAPRRHRHAISSTFLGAIAISSGACTENPYLSDSDAVEIQRALEPSAADTTASGEQLVLGRAHGCSLDPAISGLLCWGDNRDGQTDVPWLLNPSFVAAGGNVTCAIDGGRVRCWGDRSHRQLSVPLTLDSATQVTVGDTHVCSLNNSDKVRCWGGNAFGQTNVPSSLSNVRAIAAGAHHTCALTASGVTCWGDNSVGQLEVPELTRPSRLAVGALHSCVIDGDDIACWGGEVDAIRDEIPDVTAPTSIAAGSAHACVAAADGVHCWGDPNETNLTPRNLTFPIQVAVGGGNGLAHACARHQQGVVCWGDDSLKQTQYDGLPLHVVYRAEAEINAPLDVVWGVITDLDSYPEWNPYTIAMKSTSKVGDPMVMTVRMSAALTLEQTEYIRVFDGNIHKACWGINTTTPQLNSGERCQWLESLGEGLGTRYITEDLIEGSLNPIVSGLFDSDLQIGFDGVAKGLKERAESLVAKP